METSLFKDRGFGSEFIGLKNYQDAFGNPVFYKAIYNTVVYTGIMVPLSLLLSFVIAMTILPFNKMAQAMFKSMYYLPGVAMSVVWL